MATGPGFPSPSSVFIPNWEASGRLQVGYSRNPKKFPLMRWAQLVETPKIVGYYMKLSPQEAARVVAPQDYEWNRGAVRPMRPEGLEQFNYVEFRTKRRDYGFTIDDDTDDLADWEVVEVHAQIHAAKAMTARTIDALSVLTTTTNWTVAGGTDVDLSADHTATATAAAGGKFDAGTSTAPYFKIGLDKAAVLINLDTVGVVTTNMLHVLMNPNTARKIAESAEVHDYLKGSPDALAEIQMGQSPNGRYGLPSSMYGYPVIVDDTVKVTSRKGDTLAKAFAFPDATVAMVARMGELEAPYGGPAFSTLTIFWYKDDMTLERFHDPQNRLISCHVVRDDVSVLTSPLSGFLYTAATS